MGRIANWFAVTWTAAVGTFLLYGPMYATETTGYSIGGTAPALPPTRAGTAGLLAVEGPAAWLRALIPVLVTLMPLLLPSRRVRQPVRILATALLALYAFLGAMSVGLFYLPAVVALLVATTTDSVGPTTRATV